MRFVLNVRDFDDSVRFWTVILEFPRVGGWDRGRDDRGALIEISPGGVLEIVGHGEQFHRVDYRHQVIAIEFTGRREVDTIRSRLSKSGVTAPTPTQQPWGHYSTTIRDPDGLEVVLYCDSDAP
jgi:catechol 2,3-dioxygenase-like lactoylglutathione lyase family enzyme